MRTRPAELARLRADLAAALRRRESLQRRWAEATYATGTDDPADLDVELLQAEATIAELEDRLADAAPAPARAPVDLAAAPANDAPAPSATPELLTAREAAAFLRLSVDTLERMRQRPGAGPPWQRVGRRILYPVAGLREFGRRK